jgi:hypothetical protein
VGIRSVYTEVLTGYIRAILLIPTTLTIVVIMHSATNVAPGEDADTNVHFRYTTVKGYFLQSEFDADIERFSEPVTESKVDFVRRIVQPKCRSTDDLSR